MLENAALTYWLVEPGISATERARRGLALRGRSLREGRKFIESDPDLAEPERRAHLAKLEARTSQVVAQAKRLRLRVQPVGKHGVALRPDIPSSTQLATALCGSEGPYRLLSGMAHGQYWATLPIGFERVPNIPSFAQATDGTRVALLSLWCIEWFSLAVARYFAMCLDARPLEALLDRICDGAGVSQRARCWRSELQRATG